MTFLEAPDSRVGQVIGERWTLERVLGEGAMAVVYAARSASGERAAVKLLRAEVATSSDVVRRFLREGAAASRLTHPGVVRVLDHGAPEPHSAYLAMELLEGESFAERLGSRPELTPDELLEIVDQLLDVLAEAHAQKIVHRDLKPANVFLTREGRLKVLDFGIARLLDPEPGATETRVGMALGTVPYMAPEQALGRPQEIDGRTDLFAVGAIMFRVLAKRRIHEAPTDAELLVKMASEPAPPIRTVAPGVAPELAAIVDLALGFSRAARYPDARTMQSDVRAVRAGRAPPYASGLQAQREQATVLPGPQAQPLPAPDGAPGDGLVGQVLADRYRIEALIGSGGMGAVYRAQHVHMRKAVAVKVLHPEMTKQPEIVARFEREAVAAARIDHPNVAAARDCGKLADGSFYLVLEYVEGRSLRDLIRKERKLAPLRALGIARQIAAALAAAHAAGIVHRDLKPDNVMLVGDTSDVVKVLDFGIAKLSASDTRDATALTQMGAVFGTPEYMSPEQALGQAVDARADLYTLGIILYEMLTGATPFASDEMIVVLTRQMTEQPPALPAALDARLAALVRDLLAKKPAERIQTADDVLARIQELAPADPTSSLPRAVESRTEIETGPTLLGIEAVPGLTERALRAPANPWWKQRASVAGRSVPLWVLVVGGLVPVVFAVFLIGSMFLASATDDATTGPAIAAPFGLGVDTALVELRKRALTGDRAALAELEARPAATRTTTDWQALARGYASLGQHGASVAAYDKLLSEAPELAKRKETLLDLRQAAKSSAAGHDAMRLLASLGGPGADALFAVHEELGKTSPALAAEAKRLLAGAELKARASPALRVALELREARGCQAYKALLQRVTEDGDRRSLPVLEKLGKRTGCGFLRRRDCYSCLRRDDELSRAVSAAERREAPDATP